MRPSKKIIVANWILLVVLHFIILGSAYLDLRWLNTPLIVVLAVVQMALVLLYFMEVRYHGRLIRVFVVAGYFWLLIQGTLTLSDYLTRQWH